MPKGFFITATGTNVGKTFVNAALTHQLLLANRPVCTIKPVISGFDTLHPEGSDTHILLNAMQKSLSDAHINAVSPWRFRAPLSPHLAAAQEGVALDTAAVVKWCKDALSNDHLTLIEGVGGVMVPLTYSYTVLDWMVALGLPIIVVTGSYLGTLSHTLTALKAMETVGLCPHAVIVSASDDDAAMLSDTVATLRAMLPSSVPIHTLPRLADWRIAPNLLECLS